MKSENVAHFLEIHRTGNFIVQFDDGDRYPMSALDLQGENEDGEFEVCVDFCHCLGNSSAQDLALRSGYLKTPGCAWTSAKPHEPVGMRYTTDRIRSIYDNDREFFVYERNSS